MKNAYRIALVFVMLGLSLAITTSAMACKAAGKDKHVGVIIDLNDKAGTFTVKDEETEKPITFQATPAQLEELKKKYHVIVSYKEQDGKLIALEFHS
jgi:hypothetical protein